MGFGAKMQKNVINCGVVLCEMCVLRHDDAQKSFLCAKRKLLKRFVVPCQKGSVPARCGARTLWYPCSGYRHPESLLTIENYSVTSIVTARSSVRHLSPRSTRLPLLVVALIWLAFTPYLMSWFLTVFTRFSRRRLLMASVPV